MRIRSNRLIPRALFSLALVALIAPQGLASIDGGLGIGFLSPRGNEVSDFYDAGISFHASVGLEIASPPSSIALEAGFFQSDASLSAPFFVTSSSSELRWIPIDLVARIRIVERPRLAPYIGFGYELLMSRETFAYDLGDNANEQQPGSRFDSGLLIVAGIDRPVGPRLRLEGFWSLVGSERSVSRGGEEYRPRDATDLDTGTIGLRVLWRLP